MVTKKYLPLPTTKPNPLNSASAALLSFWAELLLITDPYQQPHVCNTTTTVFTLYVVQYVLHSFYVVEQ